jgi:ubiquinone/menaquinone biosynthesis C-methylase UbiE
MQVIRAVSDKLAAPYWAYELIQRMVGVPRLMSMIRPYMERTAGSRVLDVGGGTGLWAQVLPASAEYACLDNDPEKLRGLKNRLPNARGFLGDALHMEFADQSWDYTMCSCVSHHLNNEQLPAIFKEMARVTRKELIFLDAVARDAWVSKLLWSADRGSHPRRRDAIVSAIAREFEIVETAQFQIRHEYVVCVARPMRMGAGT